MRFVEFWHEVAGSDPKWLYFDSKVVDYPELSRLNQRKIHFVTIRRRGTAILRHLEQQPASAWKGAVIDIPKRCHTHIRYIEEAVRLRGYDGPIRQIAVTGLGRDRPTLFLSNHFEETPRELIIRYAGRNRIEDGLGISVNFFHLDCLASEVRLNVDLDATLTVIANGCYRWLASRLNGFEKSAPKQLYRRFVETAGTVTIENDRLIVAFDRRSHNPILREAVARSRLASDPVARPAEDRVHLPLTPTVVRGLIIFPAAEIGVETPWPRFGGNDPSDSGVPLTVRRAFADGELPEGRLVTPMPLPDSWSPHRCPHPGPACTGLAERTPCSRAIQPGASDLPGPSS